MATPVANFADVEVSTGYTAGDLSIVVESGGGSRFPSTFPYPIVWWNSTDYSSAARDPNREIVKVTNRSADTFTIERAQEGTSATDKNTGGKTYRVALCITAAMWGESSSAPGFVGLELQNSPGVDVSVKRVEIKAVESITMDDGTVLDNANGEWTGKYCDITVAGAGGLDTGSEQSSSWYDVYAIAKEDGTRGLLLHRSTWHSADANYVGGEDATQGIRSNADNSTVRVAQGFQTINSGIPTVFGVRVIKVGSPTGNLWFTIETDSGGVPSGVVLATTAKVDVSILPTSSKSLAFPFETVSQLSAATQYHVVAHGDWAVSASNYVGWRMDGSAGAYASGSKALYDSDTATWTADADDDMWFIIYMEQNNSAVVMPSGYTKKLHIGYVRNDASSNFTPFFQKGRIWRHRDLSVSNNVSIGSVSLTGINLLLGAGSLIVYPHRQLIRLIVGLTGTGGAAATAAIGDYTATDLDSTTAKSAQLVLHAPVVSASVPSSYGDLLIYRGVIYIEGTTSCSLKCAGFEW